MHPAPTLAAAPRRPVRRAARLLAWACAAGLLAACDSLLDNAELPPDLTDPAVTQTPEGALAAYHGTLARFGIALGGKSDGNSRWSAFAAAAGLLADELQSAEPSGRPDDARRMPDGQSDPFSLRLADNAYMRLQRTRGLASQAIGLVRTYSPPRHQPLLGHLYALQGYTTLFLGELFCSGVPLSTLDFGGDYVLKPGSTTQQTLEHAVALFDTALATAGDSVRFAHLAHMGRARALLGLGQLALAAAAAAQVPDGFEYRFGYSPVTTANAMNFAQLDAGETWSFSVADREGSNGLDYVSSADPRIRVTARGTTAFGQPIHHPDKYGVDGAGAIVVASGVEARLIEAEAAQQGAAGGDWLGILNRLRTDGTFTTQPNPDDPMVTDTLWNPGTGAVAGLRPLEAPADPAAQVDLLFRERAFWLFLTGHRQGDLRRLIRQYGRNPQEVYPSGAYVGGGQYGTDVTAPIPDQERVLNPRFTGCISRNA
jgi:starch-binding outer membrane protein, SusD/RagB family